MKSALEIQVFLKGISQQNMSIIDGLEIKNECDLNTEQNDESMN